MQNGLLAALATLLTAHGFAFGQEYDSLVADREALAEAFVFRCSGEYLQWWFKDGTVPPLVTAGGNGVLGAPGTRVLLDTLSFDDNVRHGGRFALGYYLATDPGVGIEARCFFLPGRQSDADFSSSGDPVLAQPFFNAFSGRPDATQVAAPRMSAGTAAVGARTGLWGTEANLAAGWARSEWFRLTALGGFRLLQLDDEVTNTEQFQVARSVPGFGGSRVGVRDEFRTSNRFYGGQVGLEAGTRLGLLTIDLRGTVALGSVWQTAEVNGGTVTLRPDGSTSVMEGGLYAVRTNIGRHERDELAFLPEVGINAGCQVTRHARLSVGYSLLWVSIVARAGEQIDPVVNEKLVPVKSPPGPLVGPARPTFPFAEADFWAQGLSFALELRY